MKNVLLIILGIILAPILLPGVIVGFLIYGLFSLWDAEELGMALGMACGIIATFFWLYFLFTFFNL